MSKFGFAREPAAWIGLISAAAAFAAVFGLHAPQGFEAAAAALATAVGAVVIRSQVTPAKGADFTVSASVTAHPKKTAAKKKAK